MADDNRTNFQEAIRIANVVSIKSAAAGAMHKVRTKHDIAQFNVTHTLVMTVFGTLVILYAVTVHHVVRNLERIRRLNVV